MSGYVHAVKLQLGTMTAFTISTITAGYTAIRNA